MRNFLCGVESVMRFMNVHLNRIISNLERISSISTLPTSPEKVLGTPMMQAP